MDNKIIELRNQAVRAHLEDGRSLRATARLLGRHYQTVYRWIKRYKAGGTAGLIAGYKKPWNRIHPDREEMIVAMKEKEPGLTVRRARTILARHGDVISVKAIWGIWKRYGYAGYRRENMTNSHIEYGPWSREAEKKIILVNFLIRADQPENAAEVLNSIPFLPANDLLSRVPEKILNSRRRIEKLFSRFGKIPLDVYLKEVRRFQRACRRKDLNYSALRLGIKEVMALEWKARPLEQLKKIARLKGMICGRHARLSPLLFEPHFTLLISEGIAQAFLLNIKAATAIAHSCGRRLNNRPNPSGYFMFDLSSLYIALEDFRNAEKWLVRILGKLDEKTEKAVRGNLALIHLYKGELGKAKRVGGAAVFGLWLPDTWLRLFQAQMSLIKGEPHKAIDLALDTLFSLKRERLSRGLFDASLTIASAYSSLGEIHKAKSVLRGIRQFFMKQNLRKEVSLIDTLVGHSDIIDPGEGILPSIRLALMLKKSRFKKAVRYAREKNLQSFFSRYVFFFTATVSQLVEAGAKVGLPKKVLGLPVFNREIPVYNIRFLGRLIVYKNQRLRRIRLSPKESAFLIQWAMRAPEPGHSIALPEIYDNFWKGRSNPARYLSHLLTRLRKSLKIPLHLLVVSRSQGNPVLTNKGLYFLTDYNEFVEILARAKALEKTGEWQFARQRFLEAFSLIRGGLFKKMYDGWSENLRTAVINRLGSEIESAVKFCKIRGDDDTAGKIFARSRAVYGHPA